MDLFIIYLLKFLVAFLFIFLYYRLFIVKKEEKNKNKKLVPELELFIKINNIDMKKITNYKLLNVLSVFNSLIVALTLLSTEITDKLILKLLMAIPVGGILMYLTYKLLGLYYKKKGMTKKCTTTKK